MDTQTNMEILKQGSSEEKGEDARLEALVGAIAISDMVKTTLGPSGMDKILESMEGGVRITNDGATILKSVVIENAAARVLIDISRVEDETAGDGTTSVCVLAGELLKQAKMLLEERIHPMTVIEGFRKASEIAEKELRLSANEPEDLHADLLKIAKTTMSSKILQECEDLFAQLAVDAIIKLGGDMELKNVEILKRAGGQLTDSYLDSGFLLDKKLAPGCPKRVEHAKILLANTALDTDKIKIQGSKIKVDSHEKLEEIEEAERAKILEKCSKIASYGCDCFINRQLIYDVPMEALSKRMMVIEHADFDGIERLSLVLGKCDIISTFDAPGTVKLGACDIIEEIMIGEERLIRFSGLPNQRACTIVLRGASGHILDEAERSLHDALCVVEETIAKEKLIVLGAGNAETACANAVEDASREETGKLAICMEGFANALRELPVIVACNGGYDGEELAGVLRKELYAGNLDVGLDMRNGDICNVKELGVYESYWMKSHVLAYAAEAAEQILRVDSIINEAPRKPE